MYDATLAKNSTDAITNVLRSHDATDIVSVEVVAEDSVPDTRYSVYAVEVTTRAVLEGEAEMPMK